MYCEKCKKTFNKETNFCDICGEKLIEKTVSPKIKKNKKSKKNILLIIILITIAIISIVGSTIFFGVSLFKYLDKIGTLEYIKLDNDKIPTIYTINNSIQIDYYYKEISIDETEIEIEYYDDLYDYDMVNEYIKLLETNGFTYIENEINDWYLIKESNDTGKIIIVNIYEQYDYDGEMYFSITYEKEKGNISNHVKEVTYKRVGKEKYGFIDIDSTWQPGPGEDNLINFGSNEGMLTLYYIESPTFTSKEYMNRIYGYVEQEGASEIDVIEVTIDGYDGYQLSAYYEQEDICIAIWCFQDNDNIIHYIEIETYKYNNEAFSKIESYSVLK